MHLIEVSEFVSNAQPGALRRQALYVERILKASDARKELGSQAYFRREPALVLSKAQAAVMRQDSIETMPLYRKVCRALFMMRVWARAFLAKGSRYSSATLICCSKVLLSANLSHNL